MRRLVSPLLLALVASAFVAGCSGGEQNTAADAKAASAGIAQGSGQGDPPPDAPKKGSAAGGG